MKDPTRVLSVRDRRTLAMPSMRLVVLKGPDKGRAAPLSTEELVVGSGRSADLKLRDPTVSRNHLSVRVEPDGWHLTDLGSTNGTFVDGRRIGSAWLEPGDKIALGSTVLKLEAQPGEVALPLSPSESFGRMRGRSVAARRLFELLERLAPEPTAVLLVGETGSGKDLAAESLHEAGPRRDQPFVVVDCAALVGPLMESELFGHERGAFTGAETRHAGAFEAAHGGTLFLDEVGELPRELQPKLLRALESGEVRPLGAAQARPVDVRVIAATNRDLKLDVNRGLFREDLYYRLAVVTVRVPPLRERAEDIALLLEHFWRERAGDPAAEPPQGLVAAFEAHAWPGNVRELKNRVERALVTLQPDISTVVPRPGAASYREAKAAAVAAFERAFVEELLQKTGGNVSAAARAASMDRPFLTKLIQKYGLQKKG